MTEPDIIYLASSVLFSIFASFTQTTSKDAIHNRERFNGQTARWITTYTFVSGMIGALGWWVGTMLRWSPIGGVILASFLGLANLTSYVMSGSFGLFVAKYGENLVDSKLTVFSQKLGVTPGTINNAINVDADEKIQS